MVYEKIDLQSLSADGVVGLAPNQVAEYPTETFMSFITAQGVV